MWSVVSIYVMAFLIMGLTHWIYKWRNPTCKGKLPPGSMGFPLIGETIQFFMPSKSLDIQPFHKIRFQKYGPVYKTNLVTRPIIVSADANFNHYILQQEEKLVELWYLDSISKLFGVTGSVRDGSSTIGGKIHKYTRKMVLTHFGPERLKEQLLPELEDVANQALQSWSNQSQVEIKHACAKMICGFTSKLLFSHDPKKSPESELYSELARFPKAFMSIPLNIPGTAFHRGLKTCKRVVKMITDMIQERKASPERRRKGDFLDHIIDDMENETFLTDDLVSYMIIGLLIAGFEAVSSNLTLAIILLTEHPLVVQELAKENEEILKRRENKETRLTWEEYKSMATTMQVMNETLRIANVSPGFVRRVIKDVHVNGYTIPEGWTLMVLPAAVQLNPQVYEEPLTFNPWRWKDLSANVTAKNFIPFGGGMRSCAGAEYSKALMAVFLHVLITKYRWTKVKGGEIARTPLLEFENGYYINVSKKLN